MKKQRFSTVILIVLFCVGLSLLLYPTVSDYWNSFHQTKAITDYVENVSALDEETCERLRTAASAYNEKLFQTNHALSLTEEEVPEYEALLNVFGDGIMGYIEIPAINCSLPIYHGTEESVLQIAVGHIEGSSLPVGGESTHCVLSGHRGLPSAKLFTNLDKLVEGDTFMIRVLDETLTYEVDQILIVEPYETEALAIEEGQDYCTLVTCTPYGINTQRLLVRGHRVENAELAGTVRITADAVQVDTLLVASVVAVPILLFLLIILLIKSHKKKNGGKGL